MKMIHVSLRVKPDQADRYERVFRDLRADVLAHEPGCTFFELARDAVEPHRYHVFEAYADDDAIKAHVETPWYGPSARLFVECLEGDHLAEIDRRGLTGRAMYQLVEGVISTRHELL